MSVSKAKQKSNRKWDKENYDQILVKLPKGTKDLIKSANAKSVNGYIRAAVYEKLARDGITTDILVFDSVNALIEIDGLETEEKNDDKPGE